MGPLVYLQILTPRKNLPTTGKRTWKRLLARMHSDMIHQLILRLERPPIPGAILPKASVCRAFRSTHVLHSQMRDDLVHAGEMFPAGLPGRRLIRIYPQALHLLLDGLPHVPEEGAVYVRRMMRHPHVMIEVLVVIGLTVRVVIRS